MSARPETPEQIIRRALFNARGTNNLNRENYLQDAIDSQVAALAEHGYVIVHPDDYPRAEYDNVMDTTQIGFAAGVNVCLDRIFAAAERGTP